MKNFKKITALLKNEQIRRIIIGAILIIFLASGTLFYFKKEGRVDIEDSLVQAPIISITSQTPGVLNEIDVQENQTVKKGDLLAIVGSESVRSQSEGLIIQTNKQIGSIITPANNVVQMVNPNDFRVVGTLDENKGLKDIRPGQVASFTVDAFPGQTFWGYVDEVAPTAKQTQAAFSISNTRPTQQFTIYVRYDTVTYPQIKNGMSAKLTIYTKTN